jgi:AbrB family looped-hinge helix DNA binding protein
MKTYRIEDIFEDIPGDSENVLMNIPEEIADQMGWREGTTLSISVDNGTLILKEKHDTD